MRAVSDDPFEESPPHVLGGAGRGLALDATLEAEEEDATFSSGPSYPHDVARPLFRNASCVGNQVGGCSELSVSLTRHHQVTTIQISLNHLSASNCTTVGLSRGSSFMIFSTNSLSSLEISRLVVRWNGFKDPGGVFSITHVSTPSRSGSAISWYDKGKGPKH